MAADDIENSQRLMSQRFNIIRKVPENGLVAAHTEVYYTRYSLVRSRARARGVKDNGYYPRAVGLLRKITPSLSKPGLQY